MTDIVAPVVTETPVQTPTSAVEAPAPVLETPKVVETLLTAPQKTPEPVPEPVKVETPSPVEVASQAAPEAVETKPDTAPEGAKPNTEGGQTENPAPPPSYDPWTLPEGVTLEAERAGKFTEILSELETGGKVPHELVQQFGQKAVDFHVAEVNRAVEGINKAYQDAFEKQKNDWKETVTKDPDLGGNRLDATIESALSFIRTHGGTPEQQTEFRNLMETTGLGNHPAVIRMFANAGRAMSEGTPLAAAKPALAQNKSKVKTLYV